VRLFWALSGALAVRRRTGDVHVFRVQHAGHIGLQFTSAARSALVLYMNVVLVPVFGSACFGRTVRRRALMKALAVLVDTVRYGASEPRR
jgi:drug/metabolite transporter (DMT)-like permease